MGNHANTAFGGRQLSPAKTSLSSLALRYKLLHACPLLPYHRMLPVPVSFPRRGHILNHRPRSFSKLLRAPARLTNLSALLLALLLAFSILFNLRTLLNSSSSSSLWDGSTAFSRLRFRSIVDTLPPRPAASQSLDHLVVVAGHRIWIGARAEDAEDDDAWVLSSWQRGRGRPSLFRAHIARG